MICFPTVLCPVLRCQTRKAPGRWKRQSGEVDRGGNAKNRNPRVGFDWWDLGEGGRWNGPPKNMDPLKSCIRVVVSSWKVWRSFLFLCLFVGWRLILKKNISCGRSFFPDFCVGVFFPPDGGVRGFVAILSTGSIARMVRSIAHLDPQTKGAKQGMQDWKNNPVCFFLPESRWRDFYV